MLDPKLQQTLDKASEGADFEMAVQGLMTSLGCGEPAYLADMRAAGLDVPPPESPIDMLVRLGVLKRSGDQ